MKVKNNALMLLVLAFATLFCGCNRSSNEVWEDTKTAGRYVSRGIRCLAGDSGDSRQLQRGEDFRGPTTPDYIALRDEDMVHQLNLEDHVMASRFTPGENGLPGIDNFRDPSDLHLSQIFQNIHFDTNDHHLRGDDNRTIVQNIADYMRSHPGAYLFIEGHCDQRGPAAYNLALGTKRAGSVRTLLVQEGVDLDHLFTISYGKERLITTLMNPDSLLQNRRAQFKIYEKK
ncbi:MAG: OmpA family protein [Parachlamydiales bacterium]|nr:OmpA family protein [Parachlamydiales bacterium]